MAGHPIDGDLIALWRCDESGTTDNLVDSGTNAWTGIKTGAPGNSLSVAGKVDTARQQTAAGGVYFTVADDAGIRPTAVTLSAWIKLHDTSDFESYFLGKLYGGAYTLRISTVVHNGAMRLSLTISEVGEGSPTYFQGETAVSRNAWHLLSCTYSEATNLAHLYIDGVEDTLRAGFDTIQGSGTLLYNASDWIVGSKILWSTGDGFDMDDVALYDVAKSAAFFAAVAATPSSLVSDLQDSDGPTRRLYLKIDGHKDVFWEAGEWVLGPDGQPVAGEGPPGAHPITEDCLALWRFDEYVATADALDDTGNEHTAVQTDSPPVVAAGKLGGARRINGADDVLTVADAARLHPQVFTVAGWVYPRSGTQTEAASIWYNDACAIRINSTGLNLDCELFFDDASTLDVETGDALTNATWNHVVVTWDGTTLSVYIDGVLVGSDTDPGKTLDYSDATGILFGNHIGSSSTPTLINGVTATYIYDGALAADPTWVATVGDNLTLVGAGAAPTFNDGGSPWSASLADDSVKFNGAKYFERSGDTSYANPGTNSFWIKLLYKHVNETGVILGKYKSGGTPGSLEMFSVVTAPRQLNFSVDDGPDLASMSINPHSDGWHAMDFVHHAGNWVRAYADGVQVEADMDVSAIGSLSVIEPFSIGARSTAGATPSNASIAYCAMWQGAGTDLISTHDQDTLVAAHYAALSAGSAADWDGDLDDFAFYAIPKTAEWVRRAYNNGNDWSRPGVACLVAPEQEHSAAINFKDFDETIPGNMTAGLINYEDPIAPSTHPLAKLFAPGRWESDNAKWTWLKRIAETQKYIDADATTITVRPSLDGWPSSGEAHIGGETFSYETVSEDVNGISPEKVDRFNDVIKGLYPCVGSEATWGYTYRWPRADGGVGGMGDNVAVSTVPYSWIGRRFALYVVAWDKSADKWYPEEDVELLWVGTISEEIVYDGKGQWQLSGEHIAALMDQEIGQDFLGETRLYGINLTGPAGLRFHVIEYDDHTPQAEIDVTIDAGWYLSHDVLAFEITKELNVSGNWSALGGGSHDGNASFFLFFDASSGVYQLQYAGSNDRNFYFSTYQQITAGQGTSYACHAFHALGFATVDHHGGRSFLSKTNFTDPGFWMIDQHGNGLFSVWAGSAPFVAYQPLNSMVNGLRLYAYEAEKRLVADQGGYAIGRAYLRMGDVYVAINEINPDGDIHEIVLDGTQPPRTGNYLSVGQLHGERFVRIQQVGVLEHAIGANPSVFGSGSIGPLKALLPSLLSTGTAGYNHATYDSGPLGWSVGMQASLVDIVGIEAMDAVLLARAQDLAERRFMVIPESVSWRKDLWRAEAKLFGLALVFDRGKFRVKDLLSPAIDAASVTLGAATAANPDERPRVITSSKHVINQTVIELYNHQAEDFEPPITINDMASIQGLGGLVKKMSLKHYGIALDHLSATPQELLRENFGQMSSLLRYPWQEVTVSLAADQILRFAVGDVVIYTSNNHPDPYGDGTMDSTIYGIVINLQWSYSRWRGTATLLLYSRFSGDLFKPWASAAVIDVTHDTGDYTSGYDSTAKKIKLLAREYGISGDSDDGSRFSDGDKILIHERYPEDPTAPATGPYAAEIVGGYNDVDNELTLTTAAMAGYDTDMEYLVTPDVHGTATATQTAGNSYQADTTSGELSGNTRADRWG